MIIRKGLLDSCWAFRFLFNNILGSFCLTCSLEVMPQHFKWLEVTTLDWATLEGILSSVEATLSLNDFCTLRYCLWLHPAGRVVFCLFLSACSVQPLFARIQLKWQLSVFPSAEMEKETKMKTGGCYSKWRSISEPWKPTRAGGTGIKVHPLRGDLPSSLYDIGKMPPKDWNTSFMSTLSWDSSEQRRRWPEC